MKAYTGTDRNLNIVVFIVLFLSGSFMASNDILSSVITRSIWVVLLVYLALNAGIYRRALKIHAVYLVLIFALILSTLINGGNINICISITVYIMVALLIQTIWSYEMFRDAYKRCIYNLCCISLVCVVLYAAIPQLRQLFTVSNINGTATYSCLGVYVRNLNETGIGRNNGMFWEPGAYSTFVCLAMLFETLEQKPNIKYLVVFTATVLTTFSTTGYFALAMIFMMLFLRVYKNNKQIRRVLVLAIAIIAAIMIIKRDVFFSTENYTTFGKLILYKSSSAYQNRVSSISIRINSVIQPIIVFFANPLLGVGDVKFRELLFETTWGVTTCTFMNWFAIFGIAVGSIFMGGTISIIKQSGKGLMQKIVLFCTLFTITASENYVANAMVIIVLLYGYTLKEKNTYYPELQTEKEEA